MAFRFLTYHQKTLRIIFLISGHYFIGLRTFYSSIYYAVKLYKKFYIAFNHICINKTT